MAKVEIDHVLATGEANDLTIIDKGGRVWIYGVDKWIHAMDIPDEPAENVMEEIAH